MNRQEVAQVLVKVQQGDQRQTDRTVLVFWSEVIDEWEVRNGPVTLEDTIAGVVMHRAEKPGVWCEPGHVMAGAARARASRERQERLARPAIEPNRITLDRAEHEAEFQAALAAERARRQEAGT